MVSSGNMQKKKDIKVSNNNYCVYKHTFPNGKVYIGITRRKPEKRWRTNGSGYWYQNKTLFFAIKKYGWENIKHDVLFENISKEEAYSKEIELISFYDSINPEKGYYISSGGASGIKHSEETKKKLSIAHTGKKYSKEIKLKMSLAHMGKKQSYEHIKKHTEARKRPLYRISLEGKIIDKFSGVKDAAVFLNKPQAGGNISKACKSELKQVYGFMWRYCDELNENSIIEPLNIKKLNQMSLDGKLIKTWETIADAINFIFPLELNKHKIYLKISRRLNGKTKNKEAFGFIWKYAEIGRASCRERV